MKKKETKLSSPQLQKVWERVKEECEKLSEEERLEIVMRLYDTLKGD